MSFGRTLKVTANSSRSGESFDRFLDATVRGRESRSLFSANNSALQTKVAEITETPEVRETLRQAFKVTQQAILVMAANHEADDKTRCIEADVEFKGSPTATELRRKAARIDDALVALANPDVDKPRWYLERVLASL